MLWSHRRTTLPRLESAQTKIDDSHGAQRYQSQPWVCRGLKGLANVLYRETDESELYITMSRADAEQWKTEDFHGLRLRVPRVPVLKNVLTVALPYGGLAIAISKKAPPQEFESDQRSISDSSATEDQTDFHINEREVRESDSVLYANEQDCDLGTTSLRIFDEKPEAQIEDVDEYIEHHRALDQDTEPQAVSEKEHRLSLQNANAQLEARCDELCSTKNHLKAQRDEAVRRAEQLDAFLKAIRPTKNPTIASLKKEISNLSNELEIARNEADAEYDARENAQADLRATVRLHQIQLQTRLSQRDENWEAEVNRLEVKHDKEMKNEKKFRQEAKSRLEVQHAAELEKHRDALKEDRDIEVKWYQDRIFDKEVYWQRMVAEYKELVTDVYGRLQTVEEAFAEEKYPTQRQGMAEVHAKAESVRKNVFDDEGYRKLCEKVDTWCPDLVENRAGEVGERGEVVILEEWCQTKKNAGDNIDESGGHDAGDVGTQPPGASLSSLQDSVDRGTTVANNTPIEAENPVEDGSPKIEASTTQQTQQDELETSTTSTHTPQPEETLHRPTFNFGGPAPIEPAVENFKPNLNPSFSDFSFSRESSPPFKFGGLSSPPQATTTETPEQMINTFIGSTPFGPKSSGCVAGDSKSSCAPFLFSSS